MNKILEYFKDLINASYYSSESKNNNRNCNIDKPDTELYNDIIVYNYSNENGGQENYMELADSAYNICGSIVARYAPSYDDYAIIQFYNNTGDYLQCQLIFRNTSIHLSTFDLNEEVNSQLYIESEEDIFNFSLTDNYCTMPFSYNDIVELQNYFNKFEIFGSWTFLYSMGEEKAYGKKYK